MYLKSEAKSFSAGQKLLFGTRWLDPARAYKNPVIKRIAIQVAGVVTTNGGTVPSTGAALAFVDSVQVKDVQGPLIDLTGEELRIVNHADRRGTYADPSTVADLQTNAAVPLWLHLDFQPYEHGRRTDLGVPVAALMGVGEFAIKCPAAVTLAGATVQTTTTYTLHAEIEDLREAEVPTRRTLQSYQFTSDQHYDVGGALRAAYLHATSSTGLGGADISAITELDSNTIPSFNDVSTSYLAQRYRGEGRPPASSDPFLAATVRAALVWTPDADTKAGQAPTMAALHLRTTGTLPASTKLILDSYSDRTERYEGKVLAAAGAPVRDAADLRAQLAARGAVVGRGGAKAPGSLASFRPDLLARLPVRIVGHGVK